MPKAVAVQIALGVATAVWPTAADAGWQSTQWGMTRSQVQAAAPMPLTPRPARNPSFSSPDLVGRYLSASFEFDAWLSFNKRGGLAYVDLRLRPPAGCATVLESMKAQYGEARRPLRDEEIYEWTDTKHRNKVSLTEFDDKKFSPTLCAIVYAPLAIDQAGGL